MPKKFSVEMENDRLVSVEVDGVRYPDPKQIPHLPTRTKVERFLARAATSRSPTAEEDEFDADFDADFERAKEEIKKGDAVFTKVVLPLFAGIAALMIVLTLIAGATTLRSLARETSVKGVVVSLVERAGSDGNSYYYPVVEFPLPDNTRRRVQIASGSWPPAYRLQQPVTVRYNPSQPDTARIQSGFFNFDRWILTFIFGVLAAGFTAAAFFVRWIMKPDQNAS